MVYSGRFTVSTRGNDDMLDITGSVEQVLLESGVVNGIATVFVVGSTAAITTIEYESGLQQAAQLKVRLLPHRIISVSVVEPPKTSDSPENRAVGRL